MKTLKHLIILAVLLAAVLALPNLAMAGVKTGKGPVGIKLGATASTTLDVTMAAGASPFTQTNWNNPTTPTGGFAPGGGKSQDGVATALGVYWSASAGIITAGTSSTGDGRLLASYLDSGGNANTVPSDGTPVSGVSLTANGNNEPWLYVTNLTAWLATNGACDYDVVVYVDGVTPGLISHYWVEKAVGLGSSMTVGPNLTPPIYVQQQDLSAYLSSPGYSQASSSSYGSAGPANYMVFAGLTADSILIRSEEDQPAVSNVVRSPISAVQLWPRSSDPVVFNYTPESPRTNAAADVVRLVNAASGCGISAYQWMAGPIGSGTYTNVRDAGTISGSSTVQLTISNLAGANQAEYVLVASNGTSAVYGSPIQVYVISTLFTNSPVDTTRYAGGTASFFASAEGAGTITYQWYKGSSPPYTVLNNGVQGSGSVVSGATNTTLAIGNLHTSDAGTYTIVASSVVGGSVVGRATNSAVLTVLPVVVGSYVESVVTNGAVNYWRLGESVVSELAYDYAGGLNGVYGAASHIGVFNPGPRSTSGYQGFDSTNSCLAGLGGTTPVNDSWATVPALNLNTNTVTIVAWVYLPQAQNGGTGILMTRHNGTTAGFGFSAGINGGATNLNELGCVWNNGAAANYHSGLCVSNGVWSMVALVVSPTNLTFYSADTDSGIRSSTIAVNTINEAWAGPGTIGYDDTMGLDRLLNGYIDEVAVFKRSLSAAEIGRLWVAGVYNSVVQLPIITQQPKPEAVYATRTAYFSAVALSGGTNTTYRWQKVSGTGSPALLSNGSGVSGATTPNLTIASVQSSTVGDYRLVVTNSAGWSTSQVATLSVSNLFGTYETAVVSTAPVAYWRFNESLGSGYAYDCVGGHTAAYDVNALYGYSGPTPPDLPGFENANLAMSMRVPPGYDQSWVEVPPLNLNTNAVTIAAWIYPLGVQQNGAGLVYQRQGTTTAGFCFCNTTSLGYNWSNLSGAYGWNSGLKPPSNQWSFVTLVVQSNLATIYLINHDGQQWATNILNHPVQAFAGVTQIGNDPYAVAPPPGFGAAGASRTFWGYIDEVAIWNTALSSNQVNAVYAGADSLYIARQPASTNTYAGFTIQLSSLGGGQVPIYYRWYSNNVALPENGHFSGTTSPTLTINSITFRDAADYTVVVSNRYGSIISDVATVTVKDPAYRIVFSPTNAITIDALLTNQVGMLVGAATWVNSRTVTINDGPSVYTYNFTANGSVATANGTGAGAGAFTHDTGNGDFNAVLNNKRWDQGPKTIGITNLVAGHRYSVYLFGLDDEAAYGLRRAYFQDPYDPSDVSSVFLMTNDVYVVATVTAETNYLTIIEQFTGFTNSSGNLVDVGMGNINAVVVRDLTLTTAFSQHPVSFARYAGYPMPPLSAVAASSLPTTYQWQKGSGGVYTNFGSSGTLTNYVPVYLSSPLGLGDYRLALNNSSGTYTSQVAALTVAPLPAAGTFPASVLSYSPYAYWRLDETTNTSPAYDFVGGFHGTYGTNAVLGSAGVPASFPGFGSTNSCLSPVANQANTAATIPPLNLNENHLTFLAWVYPVGDQAKPSGIIFSRDSTIQAGLSFGNDPDYANQVSYFRNDGGVNRRQNSSIVVASGTWSMVACVVTPTNFTYYCCDTANGIRVETSTNLTVAVEDWSALGTLGYDNYLGGNARTMNGSLDEAVVFKRCLTSADITNLYNAIVRPVPEAPTGLNVTPDDGKVTLNWDASSDADTFIIKRGTHSGSYTPIATNDFGNTTFLDTGVVNGTLYYYVVSAVNRTGQGANSAEVSVMPGPPPASFTIDNAYRTTNQVVTFTDTTTNGGYNTDYDRLWIFGDGTTDTNRVATHMYLGEYTGPVTLSLTNVVGLGASVSHDVYVTNSPAGPSAVYPSRVSILRVQVQTNDLKLYGTNWPFGANASLHYVRWTNNVGLSKATWVTNGSVVGDQRFNGRDGLFTNVILGGATNGSRGFYFIHAP